MNKFLKLLITCFYGIGVIIVLILLGCMLSSSHIVLNPDSMLPMELHESASVLLALGFVPMVVITILFFEIYRTSHVLVQKRYMILIYMPSIICLLFALFWIGVFGIGMLTM